MESDSRPVSIADFFAARFWPGLGLICPENFCRFPTGSAIAPAGSAVVAAAAGFDLCRSCSAIAIVVDLGSARRRFAADFCPSCFAAAAAALVFVWDAASIARSSF